MMPLSTFDIAGRAMAAQLVRLNTIASNLANAGTVSGSEATAFRALKPMFTTAYSGQAATVDVTAIERTGNPERTNDPSHPLADADGNIWTAAVDPNQELVEMVETARQYANNVEVLGTAKALALDTLRLGR
ncbi:flagellar basal-body rod protein FlgC [Polymorphobacter glacialis]|uniref:Flagellar basal-body rod protein FlgC n=1 Tax=Sandarakinorhabdus glacialis TaxID=1614636 RepID=A0A917E596_9SPHN|nr:flagellar basal body rod protein FlgC [Polymorphobacter glacialis]GGE02241.1 flagellar basal-body rod protein FlgC [Polymorphobacter glacialis]